jgi:hypothetical protein
VVVKRRKDGTAADQGSTGITDQRHPSRSGVAVPLSTRAPRCQDSRLEAIARRSVASWLDRTSQLPMPKPDQWIPAALSTLSLRGSFATSEYTATGCRCITHHTSHITLGAKAGHGGGDGNAGALSEVGRRADVGNSEVSSHHDIARAQLTPCRASWCVLVLLGASRCFSWRGSVGK